MLAKEAVTDASWGGEGYTPVIIATMFGNTAVASYLVDQGADLSIGTEGYAFVQMTHEEINNYIRCMATVENKTPIYWAVEQDDLELVKKIADKIKDSPPDNFEFEVIAGASPDKIEGGAFGKTYRCPTNEDFEYSPSEYAIEAGNAEASEYCKNSGM